MPLFKKQPRGQRHCLIGQSVTCSWHANARAGEPQLVKTLSHLSLVPLEMGLSCLMEQGLPVLTVMEFAKEVLQAHRFLAALGLIKK